MTERLVLRSWRLDEVEDAHRLWGDARVMRWVGPPHESQARSAAALEGARAAEAEDGVCLWRVALRLSEPARGEGPFVGACGFLPYDGPGSRAPGERWLELGYHLLPDFWGRGLATEAAARCLRWARGEATRIVAFADPQNLGSRRILDKLGFMALPHHGGADEPIEHQLVCGSNAGHALGVGPRREAMGRGLA
ncbi:MAG: GNAT family N-acetyltransferase, partial [Myxococcales bacterium]|nr:GNAT family N-acetyltransferase [Myxococcales bacterium]